MKRLMLCFIAACNPDKEKVSLKTFKAYFQALNQDGDKWQYTVDTVKLWFDEKEGDPIVSIKSNTTGKWKEWGEEMHSFSYYDSIWYDKEEHAVKGFFYENNDFYKLIGKEPAKTLRTYWF